MTRCTVPYKCTVIALVAQDSSVVFRSPKINNKQKKLFMESAAFILSFPCVFIIANKFCDIGWFFLVNWLALYQKCVNQNHLFALYTINRHVSWISFYCWMYIQYTCLRTIIWIMKPTIPGKQWKISIEIRNSLCQMILTLNMEYSVCI